MRLLLVDSYDSFTHNLVQAFRGLGAVVDVVQSDQTSPAAVRHQHRPDLLVLGPGPGRPEDAGCLVSLVRELADTTPILGVCLGHQAIGLAFGGDVVRHQVVHGHAPPTHHHGTGIFRGVPQAAPLTRYHSLVVDRSTLPDCLEVTAWADDGAILGLAHRSLEVNGVQFHPESVLSGEAGMRVLDNALDRARPVLSGRTAPALPATA